MSRTLGKWTLGEPLGKGGQGRVFQATCPEEFGSQVFALKQLSRTSSQKARDRFVREIEALKRIEHSSIIRPVDHSKPDDPRPYYVMPYEPGVRPLSELIWSSPDQNPFYQNSFLSIGFIAKCADAVAYAHAEGIVHRDLKPDNILVRPNSTPLIIDFGCCLPLDDEGLLTLTDEGIGARHFMAPECEAGVEGEISAASDVYSLGKLLWCIVSGQRPFSRETPAFTNKLLTTMWPDDPDAGYIIEAMLKSVRADPANRSKDGRDFAGVCKSYAERIDDGVEHVSYRMPRCLACNSTRVEVSANRISKPLNLDVFTFIGNTANNPHLRAKFCTDCGNVTLVDVRPHEAYTKRVAGAS